MNLSAGVGCGAARADSGGPDHRPAVTKITPAATRVPSGVFMREPDGGEAVSLSVMPRRPARLGPPVRRER